ncbi:unnamed protein product, partial [Laminaria digitata]
MVPCLCRRRSMLSRNAHLAPRLLIERTINPRRTPPTSWPPRNSSFYRGSGIRCKTFS